jgi:hypothetical protein
MVKIVSPALDDRDKAQLPQKGIAWLTIESNSKVHDITFYGLNRLPYEIELEGGFIFGSSIIIMRELSFDLIENYLEKAEERGYFEHL